MNEHPLKKTLRHIAEEEFPPGTDIWPEIQQAMERTTPKRNEMAIRFSNFTRAVAFGAMLVLLTLGLVWVLSSAGPQPVASPTATPKPAVTEVSTEISDLPPRISANTPDGGFVYSNPLEILVDRWEKTLLSQAGWLHLEYRVLDPDTLLPNGTRVSEEYLVDHWYLLNEQREVIQEISILKTLDGEGAIQTIVTQDGLSRDLTFDLENYITPFTPDLFHGFMEHMRSYNYSGVSTENDDNRFSYGDVFNESEQYGISFSIRIGEQEWQLVLDSRTGQALSFKEYQISGDPPGKNFYASYTPVIEERVDQPPADILAYLDMESVPSTYDTPSLPAPLTYIVQEGDTCLLIATLYNVSVQSIIKMNGMSADCIPVVGQKLLIPQTTDIVTNGQSPLPGIRLLSLDSDSDTIRQTLIDSQLNWSSVFVDAITTRIDGDTTSLERAQIWFVDPDKSREIYDLDNDNLADTMVFTYNVIQTIFDLKTGQETTQVLDSISQPPLSILNPDSAFALNGMQSSGGTFKPIEHTIIANRETLIVEWRDDSEQPKDRLYIDIYTGVVLKWENLREGYIGKIDGEEYLMNAAIEVLEITYDGMFSEEMFNPYMPNEPIYMEYHDVPTDLTPVFVPTPGNPDTSLQYGEIYLLTQDGQTQMLHFPASCLITGNPCPQPEFITDVPIGSVSTPLNWSPDQMKMVAEGIGSSVSHVWMFNRDSQDWIQFYYAPYFSFPVWSPDGQWLVGKPEHQISDPSDPLLLVSADGREWEEIMTDQPGIKYPLGWLDNDRILLQNALDSESSEEDGSRYDEIQVYNLQTGEVTVITGIQRDANIFTLTAPVLSPDRTRLAYTMINQLDSTSEVTVIQLEDENQFSFPYNSGIASWSPNGEWLSIQTFQDSQCEIHLVHPDGTGAYKIFSGHQRSSCNLVWSPDGQYILIPTLAKIGTVPRLYIISIATGETRLIELPDVGVEVWWPVASWVP